MDVFCPNDLIFYHKLVALSKKALTPFYIDCEFSVTLMVPFPFKHARSRISVLKESEGLAGRFAELRSAVIVLNSLDLDDVIIATIRDSFGVELNVPPEVTQCKGHTQNELDRAVERLSKFEPAEPAICVKCENYVGPPLSAIHGCPDGEYNTRCCLWVNNTINPITGERKRTAAVPCSERNADSKCEFYKPEEERTTE